ncbi:MAG: type II secretion system protein GspE [Deltaproteobacteria bacterium CG11_big_fil_rev_8_21_14_0_20_49_13]|nr:MAG: type II secretion system protein GspE [Deltaproteobacteria bacterium CG11_big_fil_rev_8_21_14_0_20_49_13]
MDEGSVSYQILEDLPVALVGAGFISADQLAVAQVTQKSMGGDIGHILIKKGFVTEAQLLQFIADNLKIEFVTLTDKHIEQDAIKLVPLILTQKFHFVPVSKKGDMLQIAMGDPLYLFALDEIRSTVKCDVEPVFAAKEDIERAIKLHYHSPDASVSAMDESMEIVDQDMLDEAESSEKLEELASGTKIVNIVNGVIAKAYREHASDIHIEPMIDRIRVRYRIDGLLEERIVLAKKMLLPIVSRLKIMGNMDIAERRVPQDGRVNLKFLGNRIDLRLSTYPSMYGEKVVVRLLAKEGILGLEDLGFSEEDKLRFMDIIVRPHGIFLVTGPTGSGKTTTLYAALQRINSQEKNIISIEDPIENEIAGVSQAQVNLKAGLTFASALRSILRQDPDVIMVGEIRDSETADIALRSAMTGHFVFSTLHTNTAIGAVARLADLGLEPFLISSAILGVLSQRLVRKICKECRAEVEATDAQAEYLKKYAGSGLKLDKKNIKIYRGKGCKACRMSGYKGRVGIFELVAFNEKLKQMITERASEEDLRREVRAMGIRDINEEAVVKVLTGVTTIEEVIRVTQEE